MKKVTKKPIKRQDKMNVVIGMLSFIIIVQIISLASQSLRTYSIETGQASVTTAVQTTSLTDNQNLTGNKKAPTSKFTGLVFNEVKYTDKGSATGKDKFIELINMNNYSDVSTTGWNLLLADANNKVTTIVLKANDSDGEIIKPYKHYLICITGKNYGTAKCNQYLPSEYNNYLTHDFDLKLSTPDGSIVDHVGHRSSEIQTNGWTDVSSLDATKSLQLAIPAMDNNDGRNWCAFSPTPGTKNSSCEGPNNLVINEIHYLTNSRNPNDYKYIELLNNSNEPIQLGNGNSDFASYNLIFKDEGQSLKISQGLGAPGVVATVAPHKFWLICLTTTPVVTYPCDQNVYSLDNWVTHDFNFVIDRYEKAQFIQFSVDHIDHWGKVILNNGWPDVSSSSPLYSLTLKDPNADNNEGKNWCVTSPSPGLKNNECKK